MPKTEWRPVRPYRTWPVFEAQPFDPRQSTFIPDRSVDDDKIRSVSPRKVDLIGIKVHNAAASNSIADATDTTVTFDVITYVQGVTEPIGATFTTLTVPYDGVYLMLANVEWVSGDGERSVWFYLNSVKIEGDTRESSTAAAVVRVALGTTRRLSAGDTLALRVRQAQVVPGALSINTGEDNCSLALIYLGSI